MAKHSELLLMQQLRSLVRGSLDSATDQYLLTQFAAERDEAAFHALVRRYGPMVWRVCRQALSREHDAEDAYQSTFLLLARKAGSLRKPEAVSSWLFGVARRIALKSRARSAKEASREAVALPPSSDPLDVLTGRELLQVFDEELLRLPAEYQTPLILCCLEGKSHQEAARQLGWSEGSVKGRLERGRDLLAQRLTLRGLTLPAVLAAQIVWQSSAAASVPAALASSTVRIALLAAMDAGAAGVSASVLSLANAPGVIVGVSKIKLLAGLVFAAGLGLGGHFILQRPSSEPPRRESADLPVRADVSREPNAPKEVPRVEPQAPPAAQPTVMEAELWTIDRVNRRIGIIPPRSGNPDTTGEGVRPTERTMVLAKNAVILLEGKLAALTSLKRGYFIVLTLSADGREVEKIDARNLRKTKPER